MNLKRMFSMIVATGLLLTSFAGCGSSSTTGESTGENGVSETTIRLPISSEIDSLDPMNSAATDTSSIMMNVFESLLAFDEEGNFLPCLALDWTVADDGLSYTFTLKEDVQFHDGTPFTAKDVAYTYEKLAGLGDFEPSSTTLEEVLAAVETPDDYTVVLVLNHTDAGFLSKCTQSIVKADYADNATMPMGTGPYKFVEYIQGEKVIFKINENYNTMDSRVPTVDNIEVKIMTDSNATIMALKSGTLDIATILAKDIAVLENDYTIMESPQNMVQLLALNNAVPGLDNLLVRQAIAAAIDKEEIINLAVGGAGTQVDTFLSPIMGAYYSKDIPVHTADVELSKSLLQEAGYGDGFSFTVRVPSNYQTHVDTAQVISEQLKQAGITMNIELIEWATWLDEVYANRNYEATIVAHSGKLDPQDFLNRFDTTYARNYFNFSNERYDELINLAASSTDEAERATYYNECQIILVEQAASIFIQDPSIIRAINPKVSGLKNYPVTFIDFSSLTVEA